MGALAKRKGLKYLLEAYGTLKWDYPKLRLIGVGAGEPDGDCYRIMSERNLKDIIFAGSVSDEIKASFYKTADIYCSQATGNESFGIVLIEAMAAGTPVISSNAASIPEVCGNAALYFDPYDIDDMAEKILKMISDQSVKTEYIKRGKTQVKYYTWQKTAFQTFEIIKDLLKKE